MSHLETKLEVCPYNQAHTILRHRMQTHLHKCRKNYPDQDMVSCTHNASHHVPRMELEYHENHMCPNRHSFQSGMFEVQQETYVPPIAPIEHIQLPEPEENWDDGAVNTFDPKKNAAEKCLIRGIHCVPPSERKAFKLEHRRQVQEREKEDIATGPLRITPKKEPKLQDLEAPLRRPKELPKQFVIGRGFRKPENEASDRAGSVGTAAEQLSQISINPHDKDFPVPQGAGYQQNVNWVGMGRGGAPALSAEATPAPRPAVGAWGRGRPKF